jgi:hypothetical protein
MVIRKKDDKQESGVTAGQAKVSAVATPAPSLSRRGFLSRATVSTAVAAAAVSVPSLFSKRALASQESKSPDIDRITEEAQASGEGEHHSSRRRRALRIRVEAAEAEFRVPVPRQVNNGDEARRLSRRFARSRPTSGSSRARGVLLPAL